MTRLKIVEIRTNLKRNAKQWFEDWGYKRSVAGIFERKRQK
jgi:hypothetical protein